MRTTTITLDLDEYNSVEDDVGNLECDLCDRPCQKPGEVWWEYENDDRILSFCDECILFKNPVKR